MKVSKLIIVRHGQRADSIPGHAWANLKSTLPRPRDPPLTEAGRSHAAEISTLIKQLAPAAKVIYSSPLTRCLQTAGEIAAKLDLPIKIVVALAQPCTYFRYCKDAGIAPSYAEKTEATEILGSISSSIGVKGFEEANGSTCEAALGRLAMQSAQEQPDQEFPQTIIVAHCEVQRQLARSSGLARRLRTPFCGVTVFHLTMPSGTMTWNLVATPEEAEAGMTEKLALAT